MRIFFYFFLLLFTLLLPSFGVSGQEKSKPSEMAAVQDSVESAEQRDIVPFYSYPVTVQRNESVFKRIRYHFNQLNYLLRVILFLNLFFLISVLILSLVILYRRLSEGITNKKIEECRNRYQNFITSWLYEDSAADSLVPIIQELKDEVRRDVFTTELLSLHANLTGEGADKLIELYHSAGLMEYSVQKVNSKFWHLKAKGFRELSQMKVKEGNSLIAAYLNSDNDVLRIEAQLAWIGLNPDNPFSFYDDPKIHLTEWGQLNSLISLRKNDYIPDFDRYLLSSSKSVTLNALKMLGIYKQLDAVEGVIKLLDDKDQEVKKAAINTLGKMALPFTISRLEQQYPKEELANKTEIVNSLMMISDSSIAPFFEEVLVSEKDFDLRILSAKALFLLDDIGMEILDRLNAKGDDRIKKIIIHAKDNRI